jgi:hypothetical protein
MEMKKHRAAVWSAKSNYRLAMKVDDAPFEEELWARQKSDTEFEICCVPFFIYDVHLGDTIRIVPHGDKNLVLGVSEPSGQHTFRVWLKAASPLLREEVLAEAERLNCPFEWYDERLLALSAPDDATANEIARWLEAKRLGGGMDYETGRTEDVPPTQA